MPSLLSIFIFLISFSFSIGAQTIAVINPPEFPSLNTLKELPVVDVAQEGEVLKVQRSFEGDSSRYLVGIPVSISTGSACTHYVGQETIEPKKRKNRRMVSTRIRTMGATDLINDICILIFPAPVRTNLGLWMDANSKMDRVSTVVILNPGSKPQTYLVVLDTRSEEVFIYRLH